MLVNTQTKNKTKLFCASNDIYALSSRRKRNGLPRSRVFSGLQRGGYIEETHGKPQDPQALLFERLKGSVTPKFGILWVGRLRFLIRDTTRRMLQRYAHVADQGGNHEVSLYGFS